MFGSRDDLLSFESATEPDSWAMPEHTPSEPDNRVVNIRDAAAALQDRSQPGRASAKAPVDDLKKFQQTGERDDYLQRMITNLLALGFLVLLIAGGIWIADTMASMRKNQDCVLSGRRGCTPVDAPASQRW
jgi:hypothetical protein